MNDQILTQAEINMYVERAHQMRAEATRAFFRAIADGIRSLFAGSAKHA